MKKSVGFTSIAAFWLVAAAVMYFSSNKGAIGYAVFGAFILTALTLSACSNGASANHRRKAS